MDKKQAYTFRLLIVLSLGLAIQRQAGAQSKVLADFIPGAKSAVTYASLPDELEDFSGQGNTLKKLGHPVFFASSPFTNAVTGAMKVNGNDGYTAAGMSVTGNFFMEVWAKAGKENDTGKHTVLYYGRGDAGTGIAQWNDNWVVIADGKKLGVFAAKATTAWEHLALVITGNEIKLFRNGNAAGSFPFKPDVTTGFSLGIDPEGKNGFDGMIYQARVADFSGKMPDPKSAFLLTDKHTLSPSSRQRSSMVAEVVRPQKEVKIVGATELELPEYKEDWLVTPVKQPVKVLVTADSKTAARLQLTNGLVSREFYVSDNLACISMKNLSDGAEYVRAVKPEGRIQIDSTWYDIGGLKGQPEMSYLLNEWLPDMYASPEAFRFTGFNTAPVEKRYEWHVKYNAPSKPWPPKGIQVIMHYKAPVSLNKIYPGLTIDVHYEMYEGIPVMAKWLSVQNTSGKELLVSRTDAEVLAIAQDQIHRLQVESNYSFALANADPKGSALMHYQQNVPSWEAGQTTTKWEVDPDYNTWASHNQAEDNFLQFPHHNLLVSKLPMGPHQRLKSGDHFTSFITFEMLHDSDDEERKSLAHRFFYRVLAPQTSEGLLTASITSTDTKQVKEFIDQMGELGFERLTIDPWPGVDFTNNSKAYIEHWKDITSYAAGKGIITGGYELQIASRDGGKPEYNVVSPVTHKPGGIFGQSVCIAGKWRDFYFPRMWRLIDETGLKSYAMDGPYHGDPCAATDHPYHDGLEDSQWEQWKYYVDVLHELQKKDIYVAIPDWYFLNGSATTSMGYREASANLSYQQQLLLGRQYIFDGTWHKTPTMGWMTLQLVGFYSRDPKVGLEPLAQNIDRYEKVLVQMLGSGCQMAVRGDRLYDTPETKAMVEKWINWYRQYREILRSDIIHVSRPTGRDLDCMLHVNPALPVKGLAVFFNPTNSDIHKKVTLPLYYTGLKQTAKVSIAGKDPKVYTLNERSVLDMDITVKAAGFQWVVIE